MWPWNRPAPVPPPSRAPDRAVAGRLDDLEDAVEHLALRFERLRGSVTGAMRRQRVYQAPEPDQEDELEAEPMELVDDHALGAQRRFGRS